MEMREGAFEQLELKYCERCGGLWLRRKGVTRVYCTVCVPKMAELPPARTRGVRRLATAQTDLEVESCGLELFGVAEGGQS